MHFCYIDEAGDVGTLPAAPSSVQPAMVIVGLFVDQARVRPLTLDFIQLKKRFFPRLLPASAQSLDWILAEVKGSEVRKDAVSTTRRARRGAIGFLDNIVELLQVNGVEIVGRVYVKEPTKPIDQWSLYGFSVQSICQAFQQHLVVRGDTGIVIADNRTPALNRRVSHSIFTQKYKSAGDPYGRILEMPVFGVSDNHAVLQIADLVASALVYPMTMSAYCVGTISNLHARPEYSQLQTRYGDALRQMQCSSAHEGTRTGGLTVSDGVGHRAGAALFGVPSSGRSSPAANSAS
jgi:hypothetical protein